MRKDEIGEKIARLEQDVRTLRTDHRDGVDTILTEMRTFQKFIIEEQIETIREQLAEGYEKVFMELLLKSAENRFDDEYPDPCVRNKREDCRKFFVLRLREAANSYRNPDLALPAGSENGSDEQLVAEKPIFATPPCNTCYNSYIHEKENLKIAIDRLSECKQALGKKKNSIFLTTLPAEAVISTIVEPLSHESRFTMLKSLSSGSMTFKELSELTDSKGGHLIYHLNLLVNAGLVIKTDAGKRYSITDRGMGVMDMVKKLYSQ